MDDNSNLNNLRKLGAVVNTANIQLWISVHLGMGLAPGADRQSSNARRLPQSLGQQPLFIPDGAGVDRSRRNVRMA